MNKLDKQYQELLQDILDNGSVKKDRTGTGTKSVFGRTIRHKMSDGFPLLTTKKMYFKGIVTELLWFLRGDTNIKYLIDNGCHIWDGDAYQNYLKGGDIKWLKSFGIPYSKEEFIDKIKTDDEFAKEWGELGPVYGAQWRDWRAEVPIKTTLKDPLSGEDTYVVGTKYIDQIANLINDLKTNPDSRRLMVNAWNVGEIDSMVLPPCHYGFQVYTRELTLDERAKLHPTPSIFYNINGQDIYIGNSLEEAYLSPETERVINNELDNKNIPKRAISLMWNQRSVDTFLGLPFNIASYALLLEIIGKMVNMVPDELIGNLGDTHLYLNHIDEATEQIGKPLSMPERRDLLIDAMGEENYKDVVSGLMPFGGGMSEYFDSYKIPTHTRSPFPLPTLKFNKTDDFFKSLSEDLSLITHLTPADFTVENYQSHAAIKAPLSN